MACNKKQGCKFASSVLEKSSRNKDDRDTSQPGPSDFFNTICHSNNPCRLQKDYF